MGASLATSDSFNAIIARGTTGFAITELRSSPDRGGWLSLLGLLGVGAALTASGHASAAEAGAQQLPRMKPREAQFPRRHTRKPRGLTAAAARYLPTFRA